jgi:Holliday junction DNA helicase RuvA
MINFIYGNVVALEPTHVVIDTGGIGYEIHISLNTYAAIKGKENVKLFTYFNVREDTQELYGFSNLDERSLFMQLISINGVGPSTGIVILSYLNPNEVRDAILHEDVRTIQSVKGIGAKTAQRIILELKDKVGKLTPVSEKTSLPLQAHNTLRNEALSALITLGITKSAAEKTVDAVLKSSDETVSLEEVIKQALKMA